MSYRQSEMYKLTTYLQIYFILTYVLQDNQDDGESIIECMDGCFGLVRKKSASTNICPSRHGLNMFADQDDVDNFVENYTNAKSAIAVSTVFTNDIVIDNIKLYGLRCAYLSYCTN